MTDNELKISMMVLGFTRTTHASAQVQGWNRNKTSIRKSVYSYVRIIKEGKLMHASNHTESSANDFIINWITENDHD